MNFVDIVKLGEIVIVRCNGILQCVVWNSNGFFFDDVDPIDIKGGARDEFLISRRPVNQRAGLHVAHLQFDWVQYHRRHWRHLGVRMSGHTRIAKRWRPGEGVAPKICDTMCDTICDTIPSKPQRILWDPGMVSHQKA